MCGIAPMSSVTAWQASMEREDAQRGITPERRAEIIGNLKQGRHRPPTCRGCGAALKPSRTTCEYCLRPHS